MTESPIAVITGASSGIGYELAAIAAGEGYDLVIVADEVAIEEAAARLAGQGGRVDAVDADLATPQGVDRLMAAIGDRPVAILCANAGTGTGGAFLDQQPGQWRHAIDTNIGGTVDLLQRVLSRMVAEGRGRVLVTGSIAGFVPGSYNAVYNATKAFVNNFCEALRDELRDHAGISLTTLMPGATDTEFFARAGMCDTAVGSDPNKADPAKVARDGWDAMMKGKADVVSGWMNKAAVTAARVTPPSVLAAAHRAMAEPGSGEG
jgi:uncharacterized protein